MNQQDTVMQSDLIRLLAESIFHEQLLANWRFYALVGGVTLLANIAWHIFKPYLNKRGEILATKADMDEILHQLSETTRVTEEVRANVSQIEWVSREWRTVRRIKLEELLSAAYELDQCKDKMREKWINGKDIEVDESSSERMKILANLYFPELKVEALDVWVTYISLMKCILRNGSAHHVARESKNLKELQKAHDDFLKDFEPIYKDFIEKLGVLEKKAGLLMSDFANV